MNTTFPTLTPPPLKPKPQYMRRFEILRLAARNGIGEFTVRQIFDSPGCSAKKLLPNRRRPVYIRAVVHDLLGISQP